MRFTNLNSTERELFPKNRLLIVYSLLFLVLWVHTYLFTTDYANWWIENTLTILSLVFLIFTYKKYTFSDLSYTFIFLFLCLHIYGAKHTYAENPFGYWIQEQFSTTRNPYDRMVHFGFGFLLAYPMRELFDCWLRYPKRLTWILPIELTLSIGAIYEIIEWGVADLFFPAQGIAYLGTQGDVWDAQKDIFLGFSGALIITLLFLVFNKNRT